MQSKKRLVVEAAGQESPWLRSVAHELRQALLEHADIVDLPRDDILFDQGDRADTGCWLVIGGSLQCWHAPVDGQHGLVSVLGPDSWVGLCALSGAHRQCRAVGAEPCRLLHIPDSALRRILREIPAAWPAFGAVLGAQNHALVEWLSESTVLAPRARLARRLAILSSSGYGVQSPLSRRIRMTQADLASAMGVSRKTINELLVEFAGAGIIETGNRWIHVVNPARLEAMAQPPGAVAATRVAREPALR